MRETVFNPETGRFEERIDPRLLAFAVVRAVRMRRRGMTERMAAFHAARTNDTVTLNEITARMGLIERRSEPSS